MRLLKKSTAVVVHLGPFVDATDGFTLETALAASTSDVELWKAGATAPVDISGRTWTHRSNGVYTVSLLTTDLDTAGPLFISTQITGARPVAHEFMVLPDTTYDALVSGAALPADMTKVNGNAAAAGNLTFGGLGMKPITIGSGSTTTRIATNLTESASDHWKGGTLVFVSGTLSGQRTSITGYNGTTKELTVSALTQAPSNGDLAVIV